MACSNKDQRGEAGAVPLAEPNEQRIFSARPAPLLISLSAARPTIDLM
jgi:hypothetical protein